MESLTEWLKKLWRRLDHLALDLATALFILFGLEIFHYWSHKSSIPKERVAFMDDIHYFGAIILMLLFLYTTVMHYVTEGGKEGHSDV